MCRITIFHSCKTCSYMSDSAAILRGPMVSQIVSQLIQGTDWGELDYLFVDM